MQFEKLIAHASGFPMLSLSLGDLLRRLLNSQPLWLV